MQDGCGKRQIEGREIVLLWGLFGRVVAARRRCLPVIPDPAATGAAADEHGERKNAGKNGQPFQHRETRMHATIENGKTIDDRLGRL
jgi:hypothetical protein